MNQPTSNGIPGNLYYVDCYIYKSLFPVATTLTACSIFSRVKQEQLSFSRKLPLKKDNNKNDFNM